MVQAFIDQHGGVLDEVSIDDIAASLEQDMQRLNIGVPQLETTQISIVVQFWQTEPTVFLHEIDELYVPRAAMGKFFTGLCEAPFRMQHIVEPSEEEEDEEDMPGEIDDAEDEDTPEFAEDDVPREWIPERGRVNVLAVLYGQAPMIVGLLTERYDLTGGGDGSGDDVDLDRLNANGKRIQWIDGAAKAKRSRVEEADVESADSSAEPADDDAAMLLGMHTFSTGNNKEWTSAINRNALVCAFERDGETGNLTQVRVALALHTLDLRHTLQKLLGESRNTL